MKFKRLIYSGLVLGGILFACYIAWQQHAQSFLERLRPPSADQVRKWAGLSESTHLTMLTNVPDYVGRGDERDDIYPGKFKWLWAYEDRKGSNFNSFIIEVYEAGALWRTNRAIFIHELERIHQRMLETKLKGPKANVKESDAIVQETASMTTPDGQKSYGLIMGFFPARFAFHAKFDVLAFEFVEPISYDERHPPAERIEMPTNSFYEFFTNVDAFLANQ